jgi:hypothetical protein
MDSLNSEYWKTPRRAWAFVSFLVLATGAIFYDGISVMVDRWSTSEEYSHGFLIPAITI